MPIQKPPGIPDVYWQQYLRTLAEAGEAPTPTPAPTPATVPTTGEGIQAAAQVNLAQLGITATELPAYQESALQINRELGGSYVNGVLTAPAWWTGSITEWSRHVQEVTNTRWHLTTSPVTTPPPPTPPTPPPPPEPTPPPPPTPSPTGLFDCPYCGLRFSSAAELARHLETAHPTLPGGGGAGGGGTQMPYTPSTTFPVGSPQWTEETYGPQAGYMAGLGLYGKGYQSPYQQYQAGMYDPLNLLWQMQAPMAMAGMPGYAPTQYLSQFATPFAEDPFSMYAMARGTLGDVMGMAPEQRAGMPGAEYGGGIAQLLGLGLRQQLGPGAAWLQGRVPAERTQWQAQYPQQQGPTFLDYIRQKYNLGQWL